MAETKKTKHCEGCGKLIHVTAKSCPHCGYTTQDSTKKTLAVVGLVLNVIVLPGLGTIVAGKTKLGVIQLVLFLASILLVLVLIGIPMLIGIWVWALVTSINIIKEADA